MRYLYSILLYLIFPFVILYLKKRGKKNPEYLLNWKERFGFSLKNDLRNPIIWIHAVSVGEVRAAISIIKILEQKYPGYNILITQLTPTGRNTAKTLYPNAKIHYLPYDFPHAIINFYKTFKPKLGLIMETEIWPNLIYYAKKNHVPLFLVNARLSEKSFMNYNRAKVFITPILNRLTGILCQDELTKKHFLKLKVNSDIEIVGSTKFDLPIDQKQMELGLSLKENIKNRKVIIFASTRDNEEQQIIDNISNKYLTIVVPRHPERFKVVEKILIDKQIKYLKRSENKPITSDIQVILGDSMGEMIMYYKMSDIAIMGGSLNNLGGQNLIEPLLLNVPVVFGKSMFNFNKIAKDSLKYKCAIEVNNIKECFEQIEYLFNNIDKYNELKSNCKYFVNQYKGASQKIVDFVAKNLT